MKINKDMIFSKILFLIFLGITVALFVYVILRAYKIGFTHDESLTFTILIGKSNWLLTSNNHWLNTILSYLSFKLFGSSELALRLPNVFSFLIYSYYCYKLVVEKSTCIFSTIPPVLFLMLNPFVVDFFGLARGYGLAMAFFSGSLFYFLKFHEGPDNNKALAKGFLFSVLTIYSNYSFIIPIITLHLGHIIQTYSKKQKRLITKKQLLLFGIEVFALFPALGNILLLKKRNELYFGGTNNIIEDTLFSIFEHTFLVELINYQNWIILLLILAVLSFGLIIKKQGSLRFLTIVLSAGFLLPIILHFTLGMNYPLGRAALYWIVIFGVYFHKFLDYLFETKRKILSYLFTSNIAFISLFVAFSFSSTINLTYTQQWKYDADTRSMLEVLNKDVKSGEKYRLGINWLFEPTINYYIQAKNYDFLEPVTREGVDNKEYDYYYIFDNENINKTCIKEINTFSVSNTKPIKNCH